MLETCGATSDPGYSLNSPTTVVRAVRGATIFTMYHYDPKTALEELNEEAVLANPVHMRDMILRARLTPDRSLELNRHFLEYQKHFAEAQKLAKDILKQLVR